MKIKVTSVKGAELKPGELFSTAGPEYWAVKRDPNAIGEKVYIRTDAPTPESQKDVVIYRIEIE